MEVLRRYEPLVDDVEAFLDASTRPLPTVVRMNTIKATVERVQRAFDEEGVGYEPRAWNDRLLRVDTRQPGNTWPYYHGWVHGQEDVSAVPPVVLDPQPGDAVWDAAAAPGSKATQLAALMADTGLLVANDDNLGRLSALRSNAERLGVTNVAVTNQDARRFSLDGFGVDAFDRALVDAPCTGEGTLRKNPGALDNWSEGYLAQISGVQKGILKRAVDLTRPGGTVVYSTCTYAPEENEAVVDHVLREGDVEAVDFDVGLESRPGVTEWEGETFHDGVRKASRFYPHLTDTGGFFVAKLEVTA
ncbi:RsmB/NOP family class I SAM-dependent RNA methyltransferase [Halobacteriaceae archaeon GCM10025711]